MERFKLKILRYSDSDRLSLAKNGAIFLGKQDEDNVRRPLNMLKMGHSSIFRGEHVKFEFWTSKVVYDHLITYTTAQVRACGGLRANEATKFIPPIGEDGSYLHKLGEDHLNNYQSMIRGINPDTEEPEEKRKLQNARAIAPMSVELHYILQFNFLTLMESIFPQRIWDLGAQPDTYEVVKEMFKQVREMDSELWDLAENIYGTESIAWEKMRSKLKKDDPELFGTLMAKYGKLKSMW